MMGAVTICFAPRRRLIFLFGSQQCCLAGISEGLELGESVLVANGSGDTLNSNKTTQLAASSFKVQEAR